MIIWDVLLLLISRRVLVEVTTIRRWHVSRVLVRIERHSIRLLIPIGITRISLVVGIVVCILSWWHSNIALNYELLSLSLFGMMVVVMTAVATAASVVMVNVSVSNNDCLATSSYHAHANQSYHCDETEDRKEGDKKNGIGWQS